MGGMSSHKSGFPPPELIMSEKQNFLLFQSGLVCEFMWIISIYVPAVHAIPANCLNKAENGNGKNEARPKLEGNRSEVDTYIGITRSWKEVKDPIKYQNPVEDRDGGSDKGSWGENVWRKKYRGKKTSNPVKQIWSFQPLTWTWKYPWGKRLTCREKQIQTRTSISQGNILEPGPERFKRLEGRAQGHAEFTNQKRKKIKSGPTVQA